MAALVRHPHRPVLGGDAARAASLPGRPGVPAYPHPEARRLAARAAVKLARLPRSVRPREWRGGARGAAGLVRIPGNAVLRAGSHAAGLGAVLRRLRRALVGPAVRGPCFLAAGSAGWRVEPARQPCLAHPVPELSLSPGAPPPSEHALAVPG